MIRRAFLTSTFATTCGLSRAQAPRAIPGGVNLAGLEFNPERLPGRVDTDYTAPNPREIDYYRSAGARLIRLPFLWERLQPDLHGGLDAQYAALIDAAIAASRGMKIVLDAHQFGRRRVNAALEIIGESAAVPSTAFAAFWRQVAARYQTNAAVIFNLQNEPHDQNTQQLVSTQNDAIAAIRSVGAAQLVLVSGNAWSGAHSWMESGNGDAMLAVRDVAGKVAFDVHQYLDANSSGAVATCQADAGHRLRAFSDWARLYGKRGFLGEFGAGASASCLSELSILLNEVSANPNLWVGWTYWAGGSWWPDAYPLTVKPQSLENPIDRPQMRILRRYFT